jgi:hypothetical protein
MGETIQILKDIIKQRTDDEKVAVAETMWSALNRLGFFQESGAETTGNMYQDYVGITPKWAEDADLPIQIQYALGMVGDPVNILHDRDVPNKDINSLIEQLKEILSIIEGWHTAAEQFYEAWYISEGGP